MKKEIIPINTQIVLFFEKIIEFNTIKLANSINERLPEIGQPNIFNIPNDVPNEIRLQAPKIIFNNTRGINITITATKMDIIYNNSITIDIRKIYEALAENEINIQAIGVVNTYISNNIQIEKIQNYFSEEEIKQSDLINFSWHTKNENMNIWKRIETQSNNEITNLTYIIDINNLGNTKVMTIDEIIQILEKSVNIVKQSVEKISNELGE